jgi:hypothetical protein
MSKRALFYTRSSIKSGVFQNSKKQVHSGTNHLLETGNIVELEIIQWVFVGVEAIILCL